MESTPSSSQSPSRMKQPLSRWWWISLLICWIISWIVGAALVAVGLTSYQGNEATFDDSYTLVFVGVGFFALGFLVMIAFWAVWGVRRKQKNRLLKAGTAPSVVQAPTVSADPHALSQPSVVELSEQYSQGKQPNYQLQHGISELSEQHIQEQHAKWQPQRQQYIQVGPEQQSNIQGWNYQAQPPATAAELPIEKSEWHWIPAQPVEAASVAPAPIAELRADNTHNTVPEPSPQGSSIVPPSGLVAHIAEVDEAIAAIDGLALGTNSIIKADFDYVSRSWGSEEILAMEKATISELLYRVVRDDAAAGFTGRSVVIDKGDGHRPPFVQLSTSGDGTFRPYRIAKREDGQLIIYGHGALYPAKRALSKANDPSVAASSITNLTKELIDIGKAEGALLGPVGEELWGRVHLIGEALHDIHGKESMLQAQNIVRERLGPVRARELELVWNGIDNWFN